MQDARAYCFCLGNWTTGRLLCMGVYKYSHIDSSHDIWFFSFSLCTIRQTKTRIYNPQSESCPRWSHPLIFFLFYWHVSQIKKMEGNAVPFSTNIHLICDWNIQRRVREADSTRMVNMNVNMDTIGSYQEKKGGSTKVHERALNPWMSLEDKLILLIYQSMPLLSPKQKKVFFSPFHLIGCPPMSSSQNKK